MPCLFSCGVEQIALCRSAAATSRDTANMPSLTRKSRQTMSSSCGWPPWELKNRILRKPARCTLSPSSNQTRPSVSCDRVKRAGKSEVLVGLADRHHRQHQRRTIRRHQLDRARDDAGIDRGIDPDRQMRPVLFDRADRKDRHRALADRGRQKSCVVRSHHQCDLRIMPMISNAVRTPAGELFQVHRSRFEHACAVCLKAL